jgi:hypothetical protein
LPPSFGLIVTPRRRSSSTITRAFALPAAASFAVAVATASSDPRSLAAFCS